MAQTTQNQEVMKQLQELVRQGDYEAARAFMLAHFNELPEPMQQKMAAETLTDSLGKAAQAKAAQAGQNADFLKDMIEVAKEEVQDEARNQAAK